MTVKNLLILRVTAQTVKENPAQSACLCFLLSSFIIVAIIYGREGSPLCRSVSVMTTVDFISHYSASENVSDVGKGKKKDKCV